MHRPDSLRSVPLATVTSAVLVPGVLMLPAGATPTGEASRDLRVRQ